MLWATEQLIGLSPREGEGGREEEEEGVGTILAYVHLFVTVNNRKRNAKSKKQKAKTRIVSVVNPSLPIKHTQKKYLLCSVQYKMWITKGCGLEKIAVSTVISYTNPKDHHNLFHIIHINEPYYRGIVNANALYTYTYINIFE